MPSKALIDVATMPHSMCHSTAFGVEEMESVVKMDLVADHIRGVIETIAPHDSVEHFEFLRI
ncbi:MAG: hypothetical protein HRT36_04190 [Alphaproteobacteria bacterium]|nr:hypothetical protein [Alphaproteobacteria bacterium]